MDCEIESVWYSSIPDKKKKKKGIIRMLMSKLAVKRASERRLLTTNEPRN
jgi:hypothetical protein